MTISYTQYINYLFSKSNGKGIPLSGNFELTARCNFDCKMCYIHKKENDRMAKSKELSTKEWFEIAEIAKEKGMLILLLTGGEPFVRQDFKEIYSKCKQLGFIVSINTNASLINDEMIEFLKNDAPARINITIYGASSNTYEKLCGDKTAFEKVITNILKLKKAGISIKLNYSVTPYNVNDLPSIYKFAKQNNLPIQTASYMFPPIRACNDKCSKIERLTPFEAAKAQFEYDKFRFNENILLLRYKNILNGIRNHNEDDCQDLPTEKIKCRAGSTSFWLTYDGQMRPCGMMEMPTVNLLNVGFEKAWEMIRNEKENILLPSKCSSCKYSHFCEFCPATCYGENKSFTKAPQYICDKTEFYYKLVKQWIYDHE